MRWQIAILLLLLVLAGCTREIIREKTIIKDSTPALEERMEDLKDKLAELETKLAEYESTPQQTNQVVVIPQDQIQTTEEIPPAPLNNTIISAPSITPETIVEETNKSFREKARINELLNKSESRVRSYSFIYAFSQTHLSGDTFYLKDDKMKIKLKSAGTYNFEDYYDTVYLDITNRSAKGYCENTGLEACRKGIQDVYNLSYEDYKIKTPSDWLNDLKLAKPNLKFLGDVILFERNCVFLRKNNTFFWVDEFSGLPVRIKIKKDAFEEVHDYRHLSLNYLSESDVVKN